MADKRFEFADNHEDITIDKNFAGQSSWKDALYRFRSNKGAVIGLFFIIFITIFAIAGPYMNEYEYDAVDLNRQNLPPRIPYLEDLGICDGTITIGGKKMNVYETKGLDDVYYYFGTDSLGRDLWTRVFLGTRISLLIALIAAGVDMIFGISYGMISGYFGGKVDIAMQRIIEIIHGIPNLVIVTLLMIVLKPGLGTITLALLISGWIGMSRLVRAQVLKLKEQEYVLASRTLGASNLSIIFHEILPNTFGQIIIMAMMSIPGAIFMESFLSFIGLGIPAPQASLGVLISDGYKTMMLYPYSLAIPAVLFAVLMISLNLVADGFRDAFDPKMKEM